MGVTGEIWGRARSRMNKKRCNRCRKFKDWAGSQKSCDECRDYMSSWAKAKRSGSPRPGPKRVEKVCPVCESIFYVVGKKKYCSQVCFDDAQVEFQRARSNIDPLSPEEFEDQFSPPDPPEYEVGSQDWKSILATGSNFKITEKDLIHYGQVDY